MEIEKYKIALEVLDELQEECSKGLMSDHFSIRYSSERNLESIHDLKELIGYKIEDNK